MSILVPVTVAEKFVDYSILVYVLKTISFGVVKCINLWKVKKHLLATYVPKMNSVFSPVL